MTTQTFDMDCEIDAVDPMVITLRDIASSVLSEESRFRFEICVSEALANLVTHAKHGGPNTTIKIFLTLGATRVDIEILDPPGGKPFDLRQHAKDLSEVDEMAEGGRGLGLIVQCADDVTYGTSDKAAKNSLSLSFWNQTEPNTADTPLPGASI